MTNKKINNVIEIKPGAGGIIGMNECAQRKDENTLCIATQAQYVFSVTAPERKFNPEDFSYVKIVGYTPMLLVTSGSNPVTMPELLADMRNPKKHVTFGLSSIGTRASTTWFINEVKSESTTMVEYRGAAPLINDLAGKHVNYAFLPYSAVQSQVESGLLRIVAVSGERPTKALKEYRKVQEFVPGMFNDNGILGFLMPPNTSKASVDRYNSLLTEFMQDEEFRITLEKNGTFLADPKMGPDHFLKVANDERKRLAKVIAAIIENQEKEKK